MVPADGGPAGALQDPKRLGCIRGGPGLEHLTRMKGRVTLRAPRHSDEDELLALVRASRSLHRPWAHPPADRAAFRHYLRRNRQKTLEALLAIRREDGAIVGAFNLSQIFHGPFRNAYLGYWVGRPFSRHGYMAEGMQLLLRHAFETLKLHRVEANVQPGNRSSRELLRKAGFRRKGSLRATSRLAGAGATMNAGRSPSRTSDARPTHDGDACGRPASRLRRGWWAPVRVARESATR